MDWSTGVGGVATTGGTGRESSNGVDRLAGREGVGGEE